MDRLRDKLPLRRLVRPLLAALLLTGVGGAIGAVESVSAGSPPFVADSPMLRIDSRFTSWVSDADSAGQEYPVLQEFRPTGLVRRGLVVTRSGIYSTEIGNCNDGKRSLYGKRVVALFEPTEDYPHLTDFVSATDPC